MRSARCVEAERGTQRITEIVLGAAPESPHVKYVAIVPNLVQLERQVDALNRIESADDGGPLAPLRALLGLCDPARLATSPIADVEQLGGEELDEHQRRCVGLALSTPHFAVIEGPPGSGKTKVITSIIRRALARGERVLVVSPTHVAVDNVVERLVAPPAGENDVLAPHTLPVRYATRTTNRLPKALEYWVGPKRQRRAATISRRIEERLIESSPIAKALYDIEDTSAPGHAPLSRPRSRATNP